MNKKLILLSVLLAGCSITQPKAPVIDGLSYNSKDVYTPRKSIKNLQVRKVVSIPKIEEQEKTIKKKVYHIVGKGDYVYSIARKYKVAPNTIIKNNKLRKPYRLMKGDKLYIKTENKTVKVKVKKTTSTTTTKRYSLTRNPKLYENAKKTKRRVRKTLPVQDFKRPSKDKNLDFGYHKVRRGENLFRIGRKYDVSVFDLMAYNDLTKPQQLKAGIELKIPVAKHVSKVENVSLDEIHQEKSHKGKSLKVAVIDKSKSSKRGFVYPVKGKIISKFGIQGHGVRNDGIDISVPIGTPIRAVKEGKVMYAQSVSTLGNMILIKHSKGYLSAYTHNSKLLVRKGQKIAKGQVIAMSGNSGLAKEPMLHFELRRYGKAVNPTRLLKN